MGEKRLTADTDPAFLPVWLKTAAQQAMLGSSRDPAVYQPLVITLSDDGTGEAQLQQLLKTVPIVQIVDVFDEQLAELFISDNAQLYKAPLDVKRQSVERHLHDYRRGSLSWQLGAWVYYPWSGLLIHMLGQTEFTRLRTLRNQFIITAEEQTSYAAFRAGCVGMSVGSNGAAAIAITGGSSRIKLADGAVFSGSNLNRVRTGVKNVGLPKTVIIARELAEMNPYLAIDVTTDNITDKNIVKFFEKPWKLDVVVDEIDDVITKIRLRIEARKRQIPVIMVTEPGDSVMLDVERFDQDDSLPLFHGLIADAEAIAAAGSFKNERDRIKSIMSIIGVNNLPLRDQQAALKIGSVIPSAPQIGSTAMMAGGVIAYAVRQLATGGPLQSGRQTIDLNKLLWKPKDIRTYNTAHKKNSRDLQRIIKNM